MKTINYYLASASIILLLVVLSCDKSEKIPITDKASEINKIISLYSEYEGFNGYVLVSYKNKILFKKGFDSVLQTWNGIFLTKKILSLE